MLFNKKCVYILFLFYGSLFCAQDSQAMTPSTCANAAQKILFNMYPGSKNPLTHIPSNNHTAKKYDTILNRLARIPYLLPFFKQPATFNIVKSIVTDYKLLQKQTCPDNFCFNDSQFNFLTNSLTNNNQPTDQNDYIFTQQDVETIKGLLFLMGTIMYNDHQQTFLHNTSETIITKGFSYAHRQPIQDPKKMMSLCVARIKPVYYLPDTVERIMEKNSFFYTQYNNVTKSNHILTSEIKILKENQYTILKEKKNLEESISQQKEKCNNLKNNLKNKTQELEQLKKNTQKEQETIKNYEKMLSEVSARLQKIEVELENAKQALTNQTEIVKQEQEKNAKITSEYDALNKEYEDQTVLVNRMIEEHEKLSTSFETIQQLIEDDKKEEIEKLKKELAAFEQSLKNITNEDKDTLTKIVKEKNNIETTWQENMTALEKKHETSLQETKATYESMLEKNSSDIQTLTTSNNRLQNNNTMLTAGLLIACILFCLENIYYKNKIAKLSLLLAQ